jgi:hypothetical protein
MPLGGVIANMPVLVVARHQVSCCSGTVAAFGWRGVLSKVKLMGRQVNSAAVIGPAFHRGGAHRGFDWTLPLCQTQQTAGAS